MGCNSLNLKFRTLFLHLFYVTVPKPCNSCRTLFLAFSCLYIIVSNLGVHDKMKSINRQITNLKIIKLKKHTSHTCTLRVLLTWFPSEMVMSLERRDILVMTLRLKVIIKDHSPLRPSSCLSVNDLVPRCCLYDDSPFEMLRYLYMLPSMTITSLSIVPQHPTIGLPIH